MSELKWPHQVVVPKKRMKVGSKEYEAFKHELNEAYERAAEAMNKHLTSEFVKP